MRELSLNVLDIVQNSITASANLIEIKLVEDINNDILKINIFDNGKGMTESQIENVLQGNASQNQEQSDSTGIGMNNVISRLELYYEEKDLVEMYSEGPGKGTEVVITLPVMI